MNLVSFSPKVNYFTYFSLSNSISKLKKTRNLKPKNLVSFFQILNTHFNFLYFILFIQKESRLTPKN